MSASLNVTQMLNVLLLKQIVMEPSAYYGLGIQRVITKEMEVLMVNALSLSFLQYRVIEIEKG